MSNLLVSVEQLAEAALPDLTSLLKAVADELDKRSAINATQAAIAAVETAADAAEDVKFGLPSGT